MARPIITEDTESTEIILNEASGSNVAEEVITDEIVLDAPPAKPAPKPTVTKPAVEKPKATTAPPAKPAPTPKPKPAPAPAPEPEPETTEETSEVDADIAQTYEAEEGIVPDTTGDTSLLSSSACSFTVDVAKFIDHLNCISFDGVMEDAYMEIKKDEIKCNAAEAVSAQMTAITSFKEAKVIKEGTLIISKIDKLVKILKLFKGEITITYDTGYITITSKDSEIKVLGEAESYVNSYSQLKDIDINVAEKRIGAFDFSKFQYFEMNKSSFDRVWTTISTVNLDAACFKVNRMAPVLRVEASDGRDSANINLPIENASITKETSARFSKCLKSLVNTLKGEKVSVWLDSLAMIVKQGDNYYALMITPV